MVFTPPRYPSPEGRFETFCDWAFIKEADKPKPFAVMIDLDVDQGYSKFLRSGSLSSVFTVEDTFKRYLTQREGEATPTEVKAEAIEEFGKLSGEMRGLSVREGGIESHLMRLQNYEHKMRRYHQKVADASIRGRAVDDIKMPEKPEEKRFVFQEYRIPRQAIDTAHGEERIIEEPRLEKRYYTTRVKSGTATVFTKIEDVLNYQKALASAKTKAKVAATVAGLATIALAGIGGYYAFFAK